MDTPKPYRRPSLRLHVEVRCTQVQAPPWHDRWAIEMDETALTELSAELLSMPDPLPPRVRQLRTLTEHCIAHGLETHQAAQGTPTLPEYQEAP